MVVQEVGIPSGFAPDMSSVGNVAGLKLVEQRGRFVDVYFDTVSILVAFIVYCSTFSMLNKLSLLYTDDILFSSIDRK